MSQAWNRQMQNLNRLVNKYAKQITGPGTGFQLGESGPLRPTAMSQRFAPVTTTGANLVENIPAKGGVPTVQPNIPYENIYTNPRLMLTTSGKPIPDASLGKGIPVNKWAAGVYSSGNNSTIPNKGFFLKSGNKAFGGPIGAGLILSDAIRDAAKWAWNQSNLNTMDPEMRNAILKAAGRENEIPKYLRQESNLNDLPMTPLSRMVANWSTNLFNDNKKSNNKETNKESSTQPTNGNKVIGKSATQSQAQAIANQLLSEQPTEQATEQASEQANIQAINDYIQQLKDINQPYVEALQNYLNNYQDLYNKQQMSARRLRDMSLITGNPLWYQSAKDYNPLVAEANRINTIKTLQDAQAGDLNAINEIMGNLAVANDMGISPEAAFANKNLLTALMQNKRIASDWDRAQLADATRRYGIEQKVRNALAVQGLRNQGALERAYLNYMAFGGGVPGVAPGLNMQGTPVVNQDIGLKQATAMGSELDKAVRQNNR